MQLILLRKITKAVDEGSVSDDENSKRSQTASTVAGPSTTFPPTTALSIRGTDSKRKSTDSLEVYGPSKRAKGEDLSRAERELFEAQVRERMAHEEIERWKRSRES